MSRRETPDRRANGGPPVGVPCVKKLRTCEVLLAVKVVVCCCQALTGAPEATEMVFDWKVELPKATCQNAVIFASGYGAYWPAA